MLITTSRMAETLIETLDRIQRRQDLPKDVAYDLMIAATALRHAEHIDRSEGQGLRDYARQLYDLLTTLREEFRAEGAANGSIDSLFESAIRRAAEIVAAPEKGAQLGQIFADSLAFLDTTIGQIVSQAPNRVIPALARKAERLLRQTNDLALFAPYQEERIAEASSGEPLTLENLTALVREELSDETARVTKLNTLTGGFGKETSLFTVSSKTLNGDLVMRRDAALDVFVGLDCHTSDKEFPLLKAAFARGFPAPEPLWQHNASAIIKGPAFTIMRRAPGEVAGDATGGQGKIPAALQRTLAQVAAGLHALPELTELSNYPTFAPAMWKMGARDCVHAYLLKWFEHYLSSPRLPVPAVHGLFSWALDNIPDCEQAPGLVHGDIGFHNLLFNEGRLSAVLDWEFAHVGDPAEDLGYIRGVMGGQLDWPAFLAAYGEAGMPIPSEERVRFFEIWSHVRNAASTALMLAPFVTGELRHIKYGMLAYRFMPHFIAQAESLIAKFK